MLLPENHFHWAPAGKQQQKAAAGALLIYCLEVWMNKTDRENLIRRIASCILPRKGGGING